ncbi:MAG TPA: hypothetical protein VMJ34_17560 [Bryobacteraceae bacterium]|nr:hypothetical protein [Bryobacteraceae bacterium]
MPVWQSETTGHPTPIPYRPNPNSPHPGQGYFNIRQDPSLLERLWEAKKMPGFLDYIRVLNTFPSMFHSLGSDWAISPDEAVPGCSLKLTSYVQLAFEVFEWNLCRTRFEAVYEALSEHPGAKALANRQGINLEFKPVIFRQFGGVQGWSATFWVHAYGKTTVGLRPLWRSTMDLLVAVLIDKSRDLMAEIPAAGITISGVTLDSMRIPS